MSKILYFANQLDYKPCSINIIKEQLGKTANPKFLSTMSCKYGHYHPIFIDLDPKKNNLMENQFSLKLFLTKRQYNKK